MGVQFSISKHPVAASYTHRACKRREAAAAGCAYSRQRRHLPVRSVAAASDDAAIPPSHRPAAALVLPGFLNSSAQYVPSLLPALRALGYAAEVVPMTTADWLPVLGGGSFEWYLGRADKLLRELAERHGPVALVGHSAGGWLARLLLGDVPYQGVTYSRAPLAASLVTLGSPHRSLERYPFGRAEEALHGAALDAAPPRVRTSSLQFANHFYPSAASFPGLRLTCVCGDAAVGRQLRLPCRSPASDGAPGAATPAGASASAGSDDGGGGRRDELSAVDAWLCYVSYKSGCGRGNVPGDGVTPLEIAFLPGADSLVLPDVWHSPSSRHRQQRRWYGDPDVVAKWERCLWHAGCVEQQQQQQQSAA